MEKSDKYEGILLSIFCSADSFVSAQEIMLVLMFVPYCAKLGGIVIAFVPIALIAPFAIMPLIYALLQRFDTLLFGRYHFIMLMSAVISSPFFILIFSAAGNDPVSDACKIFFGLFFFILLLLTYKYCAFSVKNRLYGERLKNPTTASLCYTTAGALACIACVFGFEYYNPATALINTAYIISVSQVMLAFIQYLVTYYDVPQLGGKRVQSVKSVYRVLYGGLNGRTYASSLLFIAAFADQAVLVTYVATMHLKSVPYLPLCCVVAAIAGFIGAAWVCVKKVQSLDIRLYTAATIIFGAGALCCCVPVIIRMPVLGKAIFECSGAFIAGAGLAVAFRITRLGFMTISRRATSGSVFLLANLTACAAFAVPVAIAAAIAIVGPRAVGFTMAFTFSMWLGIAGAATANKKRLPSDYIPEPSSEFDPVVNERGTKEQSSNLPDVDRDNK